MRKAMNKETKGNEMKTEMNTMMDMMDFCMKSQKDFMESCAKAQKQGMEQWTEAVEGLQKPLMDMRGTQAGPMKEMLGYSSDCLTTMMNSAKTVADDSGKIQEVWMSAVEKQMDVAREMMQKMTAGFPPGCSQK